MFLLPRLYTRRQQGQNTTRIFLGNSKYILARKSNIDRLRRLHRWRSFPLKWTKFQLEHHFIKSSSASKDSPVCFVTKKSASGEFLIYFALPMTIKKGSFPITKMIQQNKRLFSIMDCFQFRYLMHQILFHQICGLSQLKSSNANNISCTIRS